MALHLLTILAALLGPLSYVPGLRRMLVGRTADGVSAVEAHQVVTSLTGFAVVYTVIFGAGLYYVAQLLRRGIVPAGHGPEGGPGTLGQPMRPLSALDRGVDADAPNTGG